MRSAALALVALVACVDSPAPIDDPIEVRRVASRVEVERPRQRLRIDVDAGTGRVVLAASIGELALVIDAVRTGPGVPITATVRVGAATLEVRNDLVVHGDVIYRLREWRERNQIVAMLGAGPIAAALAAVAPYRTAIEARLAEAAPAFVVVGLFQAWPEGIEPAWPVLDDPRDLDPPGQLDGDVIGLGMTCSVAIRCPNSAPYCVTLDHAMTYGVCTRACASDDACATTAGTGRCSQPVIDIPDVPGTVLACELTCAEGGCPALLTCDDAATTCAATQDH